MSSPGILFRSKLLPDMLSCDKLPDDAKDLLQSFHDRAAVRLTQIYESEYHRNALMATIRSLQNEDLDLITTPEDGISTLQSLFQDVLDDLRVPKKSLKKGDDAVINALYICILDMLKDKLVAEDFKYPTRDAFMQVYGEKFAAESDREKTILWQSANWMYILFKMITAKKNTGLTIEVIPKLVEGWSAKYITGGGMKPATANRVYLLHQEGKEKKGKRGRPPLPSSQKKKDRSMSMSSSSSPANTRSKRQRIHDDNSSSGGDSDVHSSLDNHQHNQHHGLSILANAVAHTDVDIETQKYPEIPQLMATTSLTWLDDDNLLDDELLFPETPILPGRQSNIVNADDVEPNSAPTIMNATSSSSSSKEPEALGSELNSNILRPPHVTRQISMGLGFNFSRPEFNREQSWTIYEPESSSSNFEEGAMQTSSSSSSTQVNGDTNDNAAAAGKNTTTSSSSSNTNIRGYCDFNSLLFESNKKAGDDDDDDESIGFPDFSNTDCEPSPRSSSKR
eukprot:gene29457-38554_t